MNDGAARPARLLACLCLVAILQGPVSSSQSRSSARLVPPDAAILVIDLPSARALSAVQPDLLATPVAPGSVLKIAALVAALESGVISADTKLACRRRFTAAGRQMTCTHPDLGRPISAAEALAYSCDDFFVRIADRLPRDALSAATASLGLGAIARDAPLPLAVLGLDGIEAGPEQLLRAFLRATDPISGARMRRETRDVLLEGLRGAARYGTARVIGDRGVDALAATSTVSMPGGGSQGLTLAVSPAARPSRGVAVLVRGGSGADAAQAAAETLAQLIAGTYGSPPGPSERTQGARVEASARRFERSVTQPAGAIVRVGRARAAGYDVLPVPLEEYVARVVAGEAAARSAPAALEALAIAVRTFAIANLGRHRAEGFDLCDLTHCQVMANATAATRQAAAATTGQILTYRGQPAAIFYTACCGGQSEIASEVWPRAQDQPFLTRHKDKSCGQLPEWRSEIAETELARALQNAGFRGNSVRDLRVARRSASGRAAELRIEGFAPERITGDDLRFAVGRTLGWQLLKSTSFDIDRTSSGYRFTGRGSGHGVGLCVVGSLQMAADGKSAAKILDEYFPGTKIERRPVISTQRP